MAKVLGLRLSEETLKQLEQLCQEHSESKVNVVTRLIQDAVNTVNSEPSQGKDVNKVCVLEEKAKLSLDWLLKPHLVERRAGVNWLVFPAERVLAIRQKSANGSKVYLEVVKTYPDAVWNAVDFSRDEYQPVKALELALKYHQVS